MSKRLVLGVAVLLLPTAARAQDEIIKDFSSKQVEKFIADVMKTKAKIVKAADTVTLYETPEGQYDLALRTTAGSKALIFRYPFKDAKVTLKQLNDWNEREGNLARCFVTKDGILILTATVSLEAGVSFKQLGSLYTLLQKEREEFIDYLKNQNKDAREVRPADPLRAEPVISA